MSGQKKVRPTIYLPYDYDKEEEHINHMSEKGWQLIKGGLFHHTYQRSDQKYRYKLDYNNQVNFSTDEYNRYISIFIEQGWEEVSSTINGWHYFRKQYDPELPEEEYELYTDDVSLKEMLGRWQRFSRIIEIMFIIFLLMNICLFIISKDTAAAANAISELVGIIFLEICISNLKKKEVFTKSKTTLGSYGGYVLFSIFFLLLISTLVYLFFFK